MPRKARLNLPGAVYHVMSRCLDHYLLFNADEDREFFLSLFERQLLNNGFYVLRLKAGASRITQKVMMIR